MTVQAPDRLARRLARVEAAQEVQDVMARYHFLLAAGKLDDALELFAQHDPRVSVTIADSRSQVGLAAVRPTLVATVSQATGQTSRAASSRTGNHASGHQPGTLLENALMSPYVFVDRSASRASGLWMAFGASSTRTSASVLPDAQWTWAHLAAEFVREHGQWRILHLRLVPRFRTSYTRSWVETARSALASQAGYSLERPPAYDPPVPEQVRFEPDDEDVPPELGDAQRRVTALEDAWAIENLMSRHEYLHAAGLNELELETCFAAAAPDLAFEPEDWGVWDGPEAIRACYVEGAPPAGPGTMTEHATTTSLVVVAADGQTAKGVWLSPGHETFVSADGSANVFWSWGRYGIDFLKVEGEWKFWRFHIYTTFRTPFSTNWVDNALGPRAFEFAEGETPRGMVPPTRPGTANAPYHPERAPRLLPEPPRPYTAFSDVGSFIPVSAPTEPAQDRI
jgi:hypothetical protein